jgi:hypothetical protein
LQDYLVTKVAELPIKWGFWGYESTRSDPPNRIFDHPCGARLMEALCAMLPPGVDALLLQLWSDKGKISRVGSLMYYPLSCVLLGVDYDDYREQWPKSAIAFLPIVTQADYPRMSDAAFKVFKAEIEAESLRRVLFPTMSAEQGGFSCLDDTGTRRFVIPAAHSWACDYQEVLALAALIDRTGCSQCCVTGAELLPSQLHNAAPLRTIVLIRTAVDDMREALENPRGLTKFNRLRTATRSQGVIPIVLTLFEEGLVGKAVNLGFLPRSVVPSSVTPFDVMHVFDEGNTKHFIQCCLVAHFTRLYGKADATWLMETLVLRYNLCLTHAFVENTKWPSGSTVFLPSNKGKVAACGGLQACEMRAVLQLLPVLLPGILGERDEDGRWATAVKLEQDYVTSLFVDYVHYYMELKRYNRPPGHTERTEEALAYLGERVTTGLRAHFLPDQASAFAYPKAHQGFGPHIGDIIERLGSPLWYTTEWGENSIKGGKAAAQATNQHHANFEQQMAAHMAKAAAASAAMTSMGLSAAPVGLGQRKTAMTEAQRTDTNQLARTNLGFVPLSDFTADREQRHELLRGRRAMSAFPRELQRYLDDEERDGRYAGVYVVNSAVLAAKPAHHPDAYVCTAHQRVYAAPKLLGRERFSFVAVEVVHTTEDGEEVAEWMGQLLLLCRLVDGTQLAFVQFLVEERACADDDEVGRTGRGALYGSNGCAALVWERLLPDGCYSYAVVNVDKLIRREFVFPDFSNYYAPRKQARGRAKRAARDMACLDDDTASDESSGESEPRDYEDDADDRAGELGEGYSYHDVYPRWTRSPFIWGFDGLRYQPPAPALGSA